MQGYKPLFIDNNNLILYNKIILIKDVNKLKNLIETGKIVSVFGLRGEVKVQPWCDTPSFLCEFKKLYYKSGTEIEIERARVSKNIVVMKIKGIDSVEEAQKIRNRVLYLNRDDVELEEGCYFIDDLIGLKVIDSETGDVYGEISDVEQTGANDVYAVKFPDGKERYIPAIPQVVDETNIEEGYMKITPIEGLFDD